MPAEVAWSRRGRWAIEAGLVSAVARLAAVIPDRAVPSFGSALGTLAYGLDTRHRRVALENLRHAYATSMTEAERRRLARRAFGHFGRVAIEILRLTSLPQAAVGGLATHEGLEHLRSAHARGRGVLVCAAHFGNWELHAWLQASNGFPLTLVTRPLDNPALERRLASSRTRSGNTIISKRVSPDVLVRLLRRGQIVGVLVDQRPRRAGLAVPFFGRLALTSPAPALLALRTGAALVQAFSVPQSDGTYRLVYEPELPVVRTGRIDDDVRRLTTAYTASVERVVRAHPELWLWMHDRWRDAPSAT